MWSCAHLQRWPNASMGRLCESEHDHCLPSSSKAREILRRLGRTESDRGIRAFSGRRWGCPSAWYSAWRTTGELAWMERAIFIERQPTYRKRRPAMKAEGAEGEHVEQ